MDRDDLGRRQMKREIIKSRLQEYIVEMIRGEEDEETKQIMVALSTKIHTMRTNLKNLPNIADEGFK